MYSNNEIEEIKEYAAKHVCTHYAVNADIDKHPKIYDRSEGVYVYDIYGKRYLDTFGSLLTTICGHNNKEIMDAVNQQFKKIDFFPNFGDDYCLPTVELSKRLEKIMPPGLTSYFFVSSGSEANDAAIKMARSYHLNRGDTKRYKVISRNGSYHGTTVTAMSATGIDYFRKNYEPMVNDFVIRVDGVNCKHCHLGKKKGSCAKECLGAVRQAIIDNDPETISCIILDPLPGSNSGYPVPPRGYLQGIKDMCYEFGILLIFDEVQTGIAKCGEMFVSEYFGVTPDILTTAKSLTNGIVPMGVCAMKQEIMDSFRQKSGSEFVSGNTFGAHNLACAAAIATLDYIENHELMKKCNELSSYIKEKIEVLMEKYSFVSGYEGIGLMLCIELAYKEGDNLIPLNPHHRVGTFINDFCYDNGLIMRNNDDLIVVAPPLTFTKENVDEMMSVFDMALKAAQETFNL
ncbi:MAG: aspartate aminotransferase family protein [Clostridia bacterium]|nr:aspartate aminotransferase family protein [Clostridia bacterium]